MDQVLRAPMRVGRVVPLLVLSAFGAIAFTCAVATVGYANNQHMADARVWLEHSHSVLTLLQNQGQRLDRVSASMQLYRATGDDRHLSNAQSTTAAMRVGVDNLETLVRDNPSQTQHAKDLDVKIDGLAHALDAAKTSREIPDRELRESRSAITVIQDEEHGLLTQRADDTQKATTRSLVLGIFFLGSSLVVIVVLFAFLIRDALRRRAFETQISIANDRLEGTVEKLKRHGADSVFLKSSRDELQLCVTSLEAQKCTGRHLHELVPGSRGATVILNNSRTLMEIMTTWGEPNSLSDGFALETCCGLRTGRSRWRKPGESEIHCSHFAGVPPENYLCIPLAAQGETIGFTYLEFPTEEIAQLACDRLVLIEEMVELASMTIAALNLRAKLESQSIRDVLTGLFNRRFMEVALERELHRATRRGSSLAVLLLDVDHFKDFNDTFGHEAGDVVLREVGACFLQSVRTEDIVCRYGGEEFVIIFPEITAEMALQRAEKIREQISALRIQFKGQPLGHISLSIGLAMFPYPASSVDELLRMADHALYDAKQSGRNRTVVASHAPALFLKKEH
ncbi:sensor domain-containing diguanylate cyclase [Terriglobus saanensis]|nr:diguanylate cyclase [Terriglobus saanensis]